MGNENIIFRTYRVIDSVYRYFQNKSWDNYKYDPSLTSSSGACIILDKGMGDFILFSHYLGLLIEFFGNDTYIVVDEYNIEFLKAYYDISKLNLIVLKRNKLLQTNGVMIDEYRGKFNVAIIPVNSITPRCAQLIRALCPKNIYALGNNRFLRKYSIRDYKVFDKIKTFNIEEKFYTDMHRDFYNILTGKKSIPKLSEPKDSKKLIDGRYFLINLDASNRTKLLSIDKWLDIGKFLSDKYGWKPVLLGKIDDKEIGKIDKEIFNCNYLNKNDMKISVSLCKYACVVLTSDTGIYHLALSIVNGPDVIIPTWSKYNVLFEPYSDSMGAYKDRVNYIRMYDSCADCDEKGIRCFKKLCFKQTVHCVEEMDADYIKQRINFKNRDDDV